MNGSVAEWLKAHDSKSCMQQCIGGSNPLASAKLENTQGAVSILAGEAITKTPSVLVLFFEKEDSLGSRCA